MKKLICLMFVGGFISLGFAQKARDGSVLQSLRIWQKQNGVWKVVVDVANPLKE
jgi:hypothetical protein